MKITGIVLTRYGKVDKARKSLSFCDEILVIKNGYISDFAYIRNQALKKARNDWVLFLDDDEIISSALAKEISNLKFTNYNGFYINRKDWLWGKEIRYGETGNTKLLRMGRKNSGTWKRRVHEYWSIRENVEELENPIYHYPHQTLHEFVDDINKYSQIHARENLNEGKKSSLFKIVLWPKLKFYQNFTIRLGFLDGMQGFVIALIMSFHSFLSWSQIWLIQRGQK